jgi:hypothetical protein
MQITSAFPVPLKDSVPFDDLWTPRPALEPLLPYLDRELVVWEAAPGKGHLVRSLREEGYEVISKNRDFLSWEAQGWDVIVTNPPYSLKHMFLERARELGGPFALLLPVTTLGVRRCQRHLRGAEVIFLPKRIDFTGKGAPWFAVAWFTFGLGIGEQIKFVE